MTENLYDAGPNEALAAAELQRLHGTVAGDAADLCRRGFAVSEVGQAFFVTGLRALGEAHGPATVATALRLRADTLDGRGHESLARLKPGPASPCQSFAITVFCPRACAQGRGASEV